MEQYFDIDFSEVYVGYECEYKCSSCMDKSWKKLIVNQDFLAQGYSESLFFPEAQIRTSYLTIEDIEKKGWTNLLDRGMSESNGAIFTKHTNHEGQFPTTYQLKYYPNSNRMNIMHSHFGCIFEGKVRCINEFRKLIKMLEI